mgnify:CR=1 FL=1
MNIKDIQKCADFFLENYLKTFYLVITYNSKSFILVGEKGNFPHLMGIPRHTYRSNGYNKPHFLFNENAELIRKKEYLYSQFQKQTILKSCEQNNNNLLLDTANAPHYIKIAKDHNIHCKINNVQY